MGPVTSQKIDSLKAFGLGHALLLIAALFILVPAATLWSSSGEIMGEIYTGAWITPSPTLFPPVLAAQKSVEAFYAEVDGGWSYGVKGEVCVRNLGQLPTEGLKILDTVQLQIGPEQYMDIISAPVDVSILPVLEPQQEYCYPYLIYFQPPAPTDLPTLENQPTDEGLSPTPAVGSYRNQAYITILNHLDWLPGDPNCPGPEPCEYGLYVYAPFVLPAPVATPTPEPLLTPTATPEPGHGQAGTTLEAEKTAVGFQEYRDGILTAGVRGEICVTNGGERATQGLSIVDVIETKSGEGQFQPYYTYSLDLSEKPVLGPGETYCYSYEVEFPLVKDENVVYRNVANVTITNHSGWMPGGAHCPGPELCAFGPSPRTDFEIPEPEITPTPAATLTETGEIPTETPTNIPTETPTETSTETPTPP